MGKTTSATRVALAPAFVPCENNRNVTFWSERAWVRTPPESLTFCLSFTRGDVLRLGRGYRARRSVLGRQTAHHASSPVEVDS